MTIEPFEESDLEPVTRLCRSLGAPDAQARVMARQLLRRAAQLAGERGMAPYEALESLLRAAVEGRRGTYPGPKGMRGTPEKPVADPWDSDGETSSLAPESS